MGQDQSSAPLRENGRDPTLREDSQTGVVRPATGLSCPLQLCKILVVGDVGVGKTCILKRLVHHLFTATKPTNGVDFFLKDVLVSKSQKIFRLMFWDISGKERFGNKTRAYYQGCLGAVVVCDATKGRRTLESAELWITDLKAKMTAPPHFESAGYKIPILLVANKMDVLGQEEQVAMSKILSNFISRHQLNGFWCCSAKDDTNVSKPFGALLQYIVLRADNLSQQEERASQHEIRAPSFGPREWQPDELASRCVGCNAEFSVFVRKHHCRKCGLVFCDSCTNHQMRIKELRSATPVRVCNNCYQEALHPPKPDARDNGPAKKV